MVTEGGENIVSVFRPDGEKLWSFGSSGSGQGQFSSPWGIATDDVGNIFVADRDNHRIQSSQQMDSSSLQLVHKVKDLCNSMLLEKLHLILLTRSCMLQMAIIIVFKY